ncbi:MAG: hypothetical protein E6Q50_00450 [Lysobacter sp.]|nr:MAG: hypothetical protein E6Q50_00450 [Lysobacter sp.]
MKIVKKHRWRKATDINREYAFFELIDGETPIFDIGFTDEGVLEVSFNPNIDGMVIAWDQLLLMLNEGKSLAEGDR